MVKENKKKKETKAQMFARISKYMDKNFRGLRIHEIMGFLEKEKYKYLLDSMGLTIYEKFGELWKVIKTLNGEIEELKKQKNKN